MSDRPTVPGNEPRWVPIREAAVELGMTWEAMRAKVKRRTIRSRKGNDGRVLVLIDGVPGGRPIDAPSVPGKAWAGPGASQDATVPNVPVIPLQQAMEMVAAANAQHRIDIADQQARHDADVGRQLAERDTLHLGTIERLTAQAAIERSLLVERVDAAEIRAERVEQRLDQVLDVLLTERRQAVVSQAEPWWRRWFGESRRTKLGEG